MALHLSGGAIFPRYEIIIKLQNLKEVDEFRSNFFADIALELTNSGKKPGEGRLRRERFEAASSLMPSMDEKH